jgi:hypothetical protein
MYEGISNKLAQQENTGSIAPKACGKLPSCVEYSNSIDQDREKG